MKNLIAPINSSRPSRWWSGAWRPRADLAAVAPFLIMCTLYGGFAYRVPGYLDISNQQQLMRDFAESGLISVAMAIPIIAGGIDLSVGSTFAVANFVALYLFRVDGIELDVVTLAVLGVGAAIGAVNGFLIARVKTRPFLTTLATLIILRAAYDWMANENTTALAIADHDTQAWQFLGSGYVLGIPTNMATLIGVAVIVHLALTRTRPGLHIMAVGASRKAARHAGIAIGRSLFIAYVVSGALAALAGLFYAARQNSAGSDTGVGMEIAALTAVIVGGVSLTGGRGTVIQAMIGAAITFLLISGFLRMNVPGPLTSSLSGIILVLAAILAGLWSRAGGASRPAARSMEVAEAARPLPRSRASQLPSGAGGKEPILKLVGISKVFGGIHALNEVNFEALPGEIHALLGENGAGKSTLAKIIAGAVAPSGGTLRLDGALRHFSSPSDSLSAGIAMVYQETSLIPTMTVAQNIILGREALIVSLASVRAGAERLLRSLGFDIDAGARVEQLGTARLQMVEIARAAQMNAKVVIFDEPTASLTPYEVENFLRLMHDLKGRGVAVIFITHALEEALAVSDRITVLRDGELVRSGPSAEFDRAQLIRLMVGRDVEMSQRRARRADASGEEILQVARIAMGNAVKDVSFSLRAGEVVGMAGLVGSGRTEIAKLASGVFGRGPFSRGRILLRGKEVRHRTPYQAIRDGVAYVTEDRKIDGFFETMTIDDNIHLGRMASRKGWRWLYSAAQSRQSADAWIRKLAISALDRGLKIIEYSGGNQQKVVLAKTLTQYPDVVFFDEPTRGVDVGAIPKIHDVIRGLADSGKAVVVISSYLPEILALSDRILVVRGGEIVAELDGETATQDEILQAAVG